MKKTLTITTLLLPVFSALAQNQQVSSQQFQAMEAIPPTPAIDILLPISLIVFLALMLISVVKYFLDYRLKNKLIENGMSEHLSAFSTAKTEIEKRNDIFKWAILFCGIGFGLLLTYFSAPIDIHSLAIMAFSIGLSHLIYFFYLKKQNR